MTERKQVQNVESKLESLRIAYQKRLNDVLNNINEILKKLLINPSDKTSLTELCSKLHQLAGTAGTFGFDLLGRQSRRLEAQVNEVLEKPAPNSDTLPLNIWLKQLKNAVAEDLIRNGAMSVEASSSKNDFQPNIWLVERDTMLASYIGQQLNSFGYKVEHFIDVNQLTEAEQQEPIMAKPALLLIDHRAGDERQLSNDPVTFWKERLEQYTCPIIFMGAEESFESRLNAVRSGAQNYFVKPLDAPRVAASITRLLKRIDDRPERILIVEDDGAFAMHCVIVLEQAGMEVRWVNQPQDLLRAVSEFSPEVILMDLSLPNVKGTEMVKVLEQFEHWSEMPIVYLSAESDQQLRALAMIEGGDAFLEKPITTELLINTCKRRVERFRQLQQAITRDGLTGLIKHAAIKNALQAEWDYSVRHQHTFSVVMLDIDHFKIVNDTYGHAVGDLVIASVGTLLRQHFRHTDKLGRYGGEEFALVLSNCQSKNAASLVEALRNAFSAIQFFGNGISFSCTLSAGVVDNLQFPEHSAEELLAEADKFLYQAKRSGRDRVCLAEGSKDDSSL